MCVVDKVMTDSRLFEFIDRAGKATYAGGGKNEEKPQRPGFFELLYREGNLEYRDSYTGHSRSGGQEVVRLNGKVVWWSGYGGGMVQGKAAGSGGQNNYTEIHFHLRSFEGQGC